MGCIVGKVWGTTELLLRTPLIEIHRLYIKPNARCSRHRHVHKWNAFIILSGKIRVYVCSSSYALTDLTEIGAGDMTTVMPGEVHWFETGAESVVAFEVYYPCELSEDIIREDCGGILSGE